MNRIVFASLAFAWSLVAFQASAVTLDSGEILITQDAVAAGNITPGDASGFPVTISTPGASFRLGSSLAVSAPLNAIEVNAVEVTIDLGGFRIAGGGVALNGIVGNQRALTVKGGTIRGFTQRGITMRAQQLRVDEMRIADNGAEGVYESNASNPALIGYARITNSTLMGNFNGIYCGPFCHIEGNNIAKNTHYGAVLNSGGLVLGNLIAANTLHGVVSGNTRVGMGNNSIVDNGSGPITGNYTPLQPNACAPQACP